MNSMMFPKPQKKKKKRSKNNKRISEYIPCYFKFEGCTNASTETHEHFQGSNRQKCIEEGLQVITCHSCHTYYHNKLTKLERHEIQRGWRDEWIRNNPDRDFLDVFKTMYED